MLFVINEIKGCRRKREIRSTTPEGRQTSQVVFEEVPSNRPRGQVANISKSLGEGIKWSVTGRYAVTLVSIVEEDQSGRREYCKIKVLDLMEYSFNDDLTRYGGHVVPKNSFMMQTHPVFDEILLTGGDLGTVMLWNLRTATLIKQF